MRRRTSMLLAFAASLACLGPTACNGGSRDPAKLTDSGYAALGKSDWKGAQSDFEGALAAMQPSDPGFKRAKMGQVEALIHTDAAKAKTEFLALAAGMSSQVEPNDYIAVASKLTGERKFMDAISVLEAGLKAHPEHPKVKAIGDRIKAEAQKAGDEGALKALKGLGYI